MILLFVCGDHVAPDVIALRGESDTERAEDGEELVEADTGGASRRSDTPAAAASRARVRPWLSRERRT